MPMMPSLPSRKISKLWSGPLSKAPPSSEIEVMPIEQEKNLTDERLAKQSSLFPQQERLKQLFCDKDKDNDGLAADIKLRRKTNERLYSAVEAYWSSLNKSKPLPFEMSGPSALEIAMTLDEAKASCHTLYRGTSPLVLQAAEDGSKSIVNGKERVLPVEGLGLALASCANTYSQSQKEETPIKKHLQRNEAYASHLSHLAAVHLALAQLQVEYTSSLSSTLLNKLARSQAAIDALYTTQKETEVAREKMEAAEKKRDKAREKGEYNRRDMEEEARMARATYEEALTDLETRTEILQESEQRGPNSGVAIMKEYMDLHLAWVEAQYEVLSKAKTSLDQYSACQNTTSTSRKDRPAPPPPLPPFNQTTNRRTVEPPPLPQEEHRKRSASSTNPLHKPKMTSRASLNDILLDSRASRDKGGADSVKAGFVSRAVAMKTPFARSESYSAYNTSNDAFGGETSTKTEGKKSRIGDIRAAFGRSSSSLSYNASDAITATTKTTPSTTGGTGTDFSSSGEKGSWTSNFLSRKIKGDGTYKAMIGHNIEVEDQSRRSLLHVQEASAESSFGLDDILHQQQQQQESHQSLIVEPSLDNLSCDTAHVSPPHMKVWEHFHNKRDSLGINSHLTGNTISSEGSNPFGQEGGELSPISTGNDLFPNLVATESMKQGVEDENDSKDGLLGFKQGTSTVRRLTRK